MRRTFHPLSPFALVLLFVLLLAPSAAAEVLDGKEIVRLEAKGHSCAITFDDGPGRHTARLLDLLRERGIPATFFVLGDHVEKAPDLVRRMVQEGHEVNNHSYDHPAFRKLNAAEQQREMERTERILNNLGIHPRFFRPPYGSYNADTVRDAAKDNLILALWSVDSLDWKYRTVRAIEGHVVPRSPGSARGIFLFHDIHRTTVDAMPDVLDKLARQGCRFVTLSQWLDSRPQGAKEHSGQEEPQQTGDPAKTQKEPESNPPGPF